MNHLKIKALEGEAPKALARRAAAALNAGDVILVRKDAFLVLHTKEVVPTSKIPQVYITVDPEASKDFDAETVEKAVRVLKRRVDLRSMLQGIEDAPVTAPVVPAAVATPPKVEEAPTATVEAPKKAKKVSAELSLKLGMVMKSRDSRRTATFKVTAIEDDHIVTDKGLKIQKSRLDKYMTV